MFRKAGSILLSVWLAGATANDPTAATGFSATAPAPNLKELIQRVIARDETTQQMLATMQFHETIRTERLDRHDAVTSREEMQALVQPGAAPEIKVISTSGAHLPLDPDQAQAQAKGREVEQQKHNLTLRHLADRFVIRYAGLTTYRQEPAYLLTFEPKPNQPYDDQTERVLNHLHGWLFVSPRDAVLLRTEASLTGPVEVAWFLASIQSLNFTYELRSLHHEFGPAWLETRVEVTAPLFDLRQHQTVEMTHFETRAGLPGPRSAVATEPQMRQAP